MALTMRARARPQSSLDLADALQMWAPLAKKVYVSLMSTFDYTASAELFAAKGRSGLRYRRFARAAEAIRYAVEELPTKVFGASLEVNGERYNATQICALYESQRYPFARNDPVR